MTTNPPKLPQVDQAQVPNAEKSFKWLIILLAIVAGCLLAFYFLNFHGGIGDKGDFGAFGDYFGGVLNPILGFATVSLLVWSLKYQMDELALSRQELALTRQELSETKEETALSRKAMEAQVDHLHKEAKLNELLRLMATMKTKCDHMLNSKVNESSISLSGTNPDGSAWASHTVILDRMTYAKALDEFMPSKHNNDVNKQHVEKLIKQYKVPNSSWLKLEELLCLYTQLALSYYDINNSNEFAAVYLSEAMDMLGPFNEIFQTDETTTLLRRVQNAINDARSIMLFNSLCSDDVTHSD
ncbi:BAR domain-containing protein [Shewanella xiamenensis]|uniref:hypothetical protein n=1 Tax=Shewanella xiamenensis TaxID=332186 RepID=UPI001186FD42|nr:hypothetical protein [Shewanella xiamenensis]TVL34504.1 hypothetical protein AYI95_03775 [Shewanella xiamenensis]